MAASWQSLNGRLAKWRREGIILSQLSAERYQSGAAKAEERRGSSESGALAKGKHGGAAAANQKRQTARAKSGVTSKRRRIGRRRRKYRGQHNQKKPERNVPWRKYRRGGCGAWRRMSL